MELKKFLLTFSIFLTCWSFGQIDSKKLIVGNWKSVGKDTLWQQIIITKKTWQTDNKSIGKYKIKAYDFLKIRWAKENMLALFEITKIDHDSLCLKGIGGNKIR